MTRLRARVAERLKGAQNTYAMLTTFNEIDMTNLMQLRADFKVCLTRAVVVEINTEFWFRSCIYECHCC